MSDFYALKLMETQGGTSKFYSIFNRCDWSNGVDYVSTFVPQVINNPTLFFYELLHIEICVCKHVKVDYCLRYSP